jgi:hypothetical protein
LRNLHRAKPHGGKHARRCDRQTGNHDDVSSRQHLTLHTHRRSRRRARCGDTPVSLTLQFVPIAGRIGAGKCFFFKPDATNCMSS